MWGQTQSNSELVEQLKSSVLRTPRIIKAFETIDRADFVPKDKRADAYGDHPLPIGQGQTISQPYTVAFMLELLQPQPGQKILDVGSGSSWTTALLAHIVGPKGRVIGLEIVPELVEFGKANLAKYKFRQAEIRRAADHLGLPKEAPFDRILVSAAANELPAGLIEQLKVGGIMVVPVQSSIWRIAKVDDQVIDQHEFPGFAFVPLR